MKNKYIIPALFFLTFLGLASCNKDFLELTPKVNQLEANYYKTESDAFLGLTAVYDALSVQNWQFVPLMSDIKSDDFYAGGDKSGTDMIQWQEQEKFKIDGENAAVLALWSRCYSGIYRANQLLSKVDNVNWSTPGLKEQYVAEAKFLRAYFYWDLARHFGWVPIIDHLITDVDVINALPQATPADVYKQIAKDLLAALPNAMDNATGAETGRVSKHVVKAMIARIYLYYQGFVKPVLGVTGEWSDGTTTIDKAFVKKALNEIITSGKFTLLSDYAEVFSWENENNNEMIFSWQYDATSGATDWGGWGINGNFSVIFQGPRDPKGDPEIVAGWSFGTLSFGLADAYSTGDPRRNVVVYDANAKLTEYTRGFQNTGFFNYKFIPRYAYVATKGDPSHNFPINYPDIRYADVLLMASELLLTDDAAKAKEYYNMVRTRALGQSAAKTSITLDDIYDERRLELAGEGHRYWDLLRRSLDYAKSKIDASFTNIPTKPNVNVPDFTARNFDKNTYGMFPIPASEIRSTNGNLKQFIPAYKVK